MDSKSSGIINVTEDANNEFWTMTIVDPYSFGLQVYNRNMKENFVSWPPVEDRMTYKESNSANAAGLLRFIDEKDGNLFAILGTLGKPNIGFKQR